MGAGSTELHGPDLRQGVALDALPDGRPFLGHADGEQVLLVRNGAVVHAIGATCTHWGGPLAEGLVVEETIRCPWHHACFSLRTGEALGAPALNPVACWTVEVHDGTVRVTGKEEHPPLSPRGRSADGPESVVIIGAGAAGSAAAETLRREGYGGPVILVDPDAAAPYDRPNLSKDYLAGNAPEEWIPLRPEGFYAEHGIERVVARAEAIDTATRTVTLANGQVLRYGALLLATGAAPVRLRIPGADLPHVHVLRSLADCRAIIRAAEQARRAVVLGASFIGMEVAAALRMRGLEVTVVAPESVPFLWSLGPALGAAIQRVHESHGVAFRLGHIATEITADHVRLGDGEALPAELVVVGVGVRAETALAQKAGLEVDDGVVVDAFLQTSAPGVYAAGDIARWPDPRTGERIRVEHWAVAQRQGQAAARNILGKREPYAEVPFFWTQHWDTPVAYVGYAATWDEARIDGDPAALDCAITFVRNGREVAFATIGRDRASLRAEADMQRATAAAIRARVPAGGAGGSQ
jgi:NADPH-dependent 2,4-dienoyl-CoA reductase/sulfur reductase-like enzyme/nitrite reductase/ring-hydroxylating ferredoxin subunit